MPGEVVGKVARHHLQVSPPTQLLGVQVRTLRMLVSYIVVYIIYIAICIIRCKLYDARVVCSHMCGVSW